MAYIYETEWDGKKCTICERKFIFGDVIEKNGKGNAHDECIRKMAINKKHKNDKIPY